MNAAAHRRRTAFVRLTPALGLALLCWSAVPAAAQFSLFGQPEVSSQDVYDTIASHGFRLAGPLMRNRDVYIADVIDRRQRRERLIISRNTGEIVQRFMVDLGHGGPYADLGPGYGQPAPRRTDNDFFSRMVHGFGEDNPPRPPADVGTASQEDAVEPPMLPRAPQRLAKPKPTDVEPRVITRREDAPITSRPLMPTPAPGASAPAAPASPPPAPAPSASTPSPAVVPPEKAQSAPPAASPAPARATVVNTDPLRIPGTRDSSTKPPAPATAVAKSSPAPTETKAVPSKSAPSKDVPVAPLD